MNIKRLYVGDLYYNHGLDSKDSYKIDLVEKDVVLVKFRNRYIRASLINFDIRNIYSMLHYYPYSYDSFIQCYLYDTKISEKGLIFVDKNSLRKYSIEELRIDSKRLSLVYDYEKNINKN